VASLLIGLASLAMRILHLVFVARFELATNSTRIQTLTMLLSDNDLGASYLHLSFRSQSLTTLVYCFPAFLAVVVRQKTNDAVVCSIWAWFKYNTALSGVV